MRSRSFPILCVVLFLGSGDRCQAEAPKAEVIDRARMFSKAADDEVNEYLRKMERETGWQVIVETVESMAGVPIDERARARVESSGVHGVYILISKDDKKVWVEASRSA